MIIEIHLLQNFVPSNLNRDDTGSPKDCEFGGFRRARISSQCQKRAMRQYVQSHGLLDPSDLGYRTKRLLDELTRRLKGQSENPTEIAAAVTRLLAARKLEINEGKTQYLLFLGEREVSGLASAVRDHWSALTSATAVPPAGDGKKRSAKERKKEGAQALPEEVGNAISKILDGGKAADVAMFGRMLADLPELNIDAACQVAHAISVNKANIEFDYYTAVDDLKPEDTAGADMIGTVELTSACFYRYAAIHGPQLVKNLQGDEDLAEKAVAAFLRATVEAIPTGKQNSTAAHNLPSLVLAVVRPNGCVNLANAFVKPVCVDAKHNNLVANAVKALDDHWGAATRMYSTNGLGIALATTEKDALLNLKDHLKESVDAVYATVAATIKGKLKENGR